MNIKNKNIITDIDPNDTEKMLNMKILLILQIVYITINKFRI